MSDASSSSPVAPGARGLRTLPGWFVALIVVLATAFLYYFAMFIGAFAISVYPLVAHLTQEEANVWLAGSAGVQFAYGLIADSVLIAGVWLMLRWLRWDFRTIGFHTPRIWQVIVGVLAVIPYMALSIGIVILAKAFVPSLDVNQKQELGFEAVYGLGPHVLVFLSLVVLPPLVEETVMRGFLYTGLKRWLPWGIAGLAVSGLFGAAHLAEGGDAGLLWVGAIDTFSLSLVLVALREATGNLWAGIVLHATKNGLAFVRLFIIGGL